VITLCRKQAVGWACLPRYIAMVTSSRTDLLWHHDPLVMLQSTAALCNAALHCCAQTYPLTEQCCMKYSCSCHEGLHAESTAGSFVLGFSVQPRPVGVSAAICSLPQDAPCVHQARSPLGALASLAPQMPGVRWERSPTVRNPSQ